MTVILTPSFELSRRIGNTNYEASVFFSPTATETFEQKFLRMIQNIIQLLYGSGLEDIYDKEMFFGICIGSLRV